MQIGAQMYTTRESCKTLEGFAETLRRIADIGYQTVQVSGTCPFQAEWLKEQLAQTGLRCVLTHTPAPRLIGETEKVIAELEKKDVSAYKELVFCGFGEPTYKMGEMTAIAEYAHSRGLKTRLNTNGQGNLINKRDIVPELKGKIDLVNVSLNAPDAESYQKICHSQYRLDAFPALVEFAKSCVKNGVACRFSVVDCIGAEAVESCRRLAESEGVPLYVRKYIADS